MRTLQSSEMSKVAGGYNQVISIGYEPELLFMMEEDAANEAYRDGLVAGFVVGGALLYYSTLPISTSLTAAVAIGSLAYNYTYQHSDAWTWKL